MEPSNSERRVDIRVDTRIRVVAFGVPGVADETEMFTRDLSLGGTLCESTLAVPLGRPVRLRFDLTDPDGTPHPVVVTALALRAEGERPCLVAFHFVGVSDRIRRVLKGYIVRMLPPPS